MNFQATLIPLRAAAQFLLRPYRQTAFFILFLFFISGTSIAQPAAGTAIAGSERLELFALSDIHLLDSPFSRAMERDGDYLLKLEADRLLAPYHKEAGLEPKANNYGGWESNGVIGEGLDGHSLGHYLSALSMIYAATGQEAYRDRLRYIVDELERCQQAIGTGYVGGVPNGQAIFEEVASGKIEAQPFNLNGGWVPWYNLHKLFAGLRDAYRHAGNEQALDILVRLSDWAVSFSDKLTDEEFQTMLIAEHGGMKEVMADVYAITGDDKYLQLADRFSHQAVFEPLARGRDNLEGLHANTQIPKIIGAARHHEVSGNARMGDIARFFWETVALHRSYVNGGNSNHEHFGPRGELSSRLSRTTSETCNTYNMLKLTRHLTQWDPRPVYADYYERALYNHILASQDPQTGMVAYYIPLEPGFFKTFSQPYNAFWCCVGTGMENHTKYGRYIYMHRDNELYVNLFIPSEVNWQEQEVRLRQETAFPEEGKTTFTVQAEQPKSLTLHLRRPAWAGEGYAIAVNGRQVPVEDGPGSYIALSRSWKDGDTVEVTLPRQLRMETMPNDDSKVAFMYGPILLAGKVGEDVPLPGQYADGDQTQFFDQPMIQVPALTLTTNDAAELLKPVDEAPLEFELQHAGRASGIRLSPFYRVNHDYYAVYWNVKKNTATAN